MAASTRWLREGLAACLVLLLLAHTLGWLQWAPAQRAQFWLYDTWLRASAAPPAADERIVILDLDDASLQAIGRWPWSRDQLAQLTQQLFERYQVAAFGLDVVFAEPDTSSGLPALQALARSGAAPALDALLPGLQAQLDYDARFAQALHGRPVVLGYYFVDAGLGQQHSGVLPPPALAPQSLAPLRLGTPASGYVANLAPLAQAAAGAGFFNKQADRDGVARRMPLLAPFADGYRLALAPATLQVALAETSLRAGVQTQRWLGRHYASAWLELAGQRVALSGDGSIYVPYRHGAPFVYLPAYQALRGELPVAALENRIVLLGSSAPGLSDLRVTPLSPAFPGVEIHAHVLAGLLDGQTRSVPPWAADASALALLLAAASLLAVLLRWGALAGTLASLGLLALLLLAWALAWRAHWVLPLAAPMLAVLGLYAYYTAWGWVTESQMKRALAQRFGQYVPPALVKQMSLHPERWQMSGVKRPMTVLFSDIRDFTAISEKTDAELLARQLNHYLSGMTRIVQDEFGTIDKYIGDALMAFWNAPTDEPKHASRAVAAALAMQAALPALRQQLVQQLNWSSANPLSIGIGINSGLMSVGNMGSEFRLSYTVMGDAVNLGSRLEGLTKAYRLGILVGAQTRAQDTLHAYLFVDRVCVKGKHEAVDVFTPLGLASAIPAWWRDYAHAYEQAWQHFAAHDWDAAERAFGALDALLPQPMDASAAPDWLGLRALMLQRCHDLRAGLVQLNADGSYTHATK